MSLDSLPPPQTYAPGYLVSSDVEANKYLFLKPHYFDPQILQVAEQTKQPVTEGEILTLTSLAMENAYAGPVIVIDGGTFPPFPFHTSPPTLHADVRCHQIPIFPTAVVTVSTLAV